MRRSLAAAALAAGLAALSVPARAQGGAEALRVPLERQLSGLGAPGGPGAEALERLPLEAVRYSEALHPGGLPADKVGLLADLRIKAANARLRRLSAEKLSPEELGGLRRDLEALLGESGSGPAARKAGADAASRSRLRAGASASLGAAARTLGCANAFDGRGCGGASAAPSGSRGRAPRAAYTASGPVGLASGARPGLDARAVPAPRSAASSEAGALKQGALAAVKEQFGTAAGIAKSLFWMLVGLVMSVFTGGIGAVVKLIGLVGMGWALWNMLRQLGSAVRRIAASREGTPERLAALRQLGYVGAKMALVVALALAGFGAGRTRAGQASLESVRSGLGAALARAGLRSEGAAARAASGPGHYQLVRMSSRFLGEDRPGNAIWNGHVRYLSPAERAPYKLTVHGGRFFDASGRPFDTSAARTRWGDRRAMFVMDGDGNIYASSHMKVGEFQHSSFLAGGPVAAAGEIVVENGVLKAVNNESGHYMPPASTVRQFLSRVSDGGVDVSKVQVKAWGS